MPANSRAALALGGTEVGALHRGAAFTGTAWPAAIGLAAVAIANLPLLYAVLSTPAGTVFQGHVYNPPDGFSYMAWMRQGLEGRWLVTDRYTAEVTVPAIVAPFYVVLGKLAPWFGGDLRIAYHVGRMMTTIIWLVTVFTFCRHFLPERRDHLLAFTLVSLAGGAGWVARPLGIQGVDIYNGEAVGFLTLSAPPHLPLSQSLILAAVLCFRASLHRGQVCLAALSGLTLAIEGLVHPYGVALGLALLGLAAAAGAVQSRASPLRVVAHWTTAAFLAGPPLLYTAMLAVNDPVWAQVARSNASNLVPIHPVALAVGYGPLAVLGVFRAVRRTRRYKIDHFFLAGWVAIASLAAVSPLPFGARFINGAFIPLCILAALGLANRGRVAATAEGTASPHVLGDVPTAGKGGWSLLDCARRWRLSPVLPAVILLLTLPNIALVTARPVVGRGIWSIETGQSIPFHGPPVYLTEPEMEAIDWLHAQGTDSVVLASLTTSNLLPALAGSRVVAGHLDLTPSFYTRGTEVRAFFSNSVDKEVLQDVLQRHRVKYVWYGPQERDYGLLNGNPGNLDGATLHPVFYNPEVTIYWVEM